LIDGKKGLAGVGMLVDNNSTTDYEDLSNKPQINNVELSGNKSSADLGLQPAGSYVTNSELQEAVKHNYSTTEQVVGTWIDGKPVYECTFSLGNIAKNSDWAATSYSMPNIDCMISAMVSCVFPSGQKAANYGIYIAIYNDYLNYYNPMANATNVITIIRYTKTTDTTTTNE
jgi:hypothetical protein